MLKLRIVLIGLVLLVMACGENGVVDVDVNVAQPTPEPITETSRFKVSAGSVQELSLHMPAESRLEFRFNSDLDINVEFRDPYGKPLGSWDRVTTLTRTITAKTTGLHVLAFDNSFSLFASKDVAVTYSHWPPPGTYWE